MAPVLGSMYTLYCNHQEKGDFVCTKLGQRVTRILEAAASAGAEHARRISTATINMVIRETVNWRAPPTLRGASRKGRIYYATQARHAPLGRQHRFPYVASVG